MQADYPDRNKQALPAPGTFASNRQRPPRKGELQQAGGSGRGRGPAGRPSPLPPRIPDAAETRGRVNAPYSGRSAVSGHFRPGNASPGRGLPLPDKIEIPRPRLREPIRATSPERRPGADRAPLYPAPASPAGPGRRPPVRTAGSERPERPLSPRLKAAARKNDRVIGLAFLAWLCLFALLFPLWPKEEKSRNENRPLAQKPAWDLSAYFSGEYGKAYENYVADQFPFRDAFIAIHQGVKRGLTGLFALPLPEKKAEEKIENSTPAPTTADTRPPETTPAPTEDPNTPKEIHMTETPLGQVGEIQYESSNMLIVGGRALEVYFYSEELNEAYARRVNHLRRQLPANVRLASMVLPTAIAFYGPKELREGGNSTFAALSTIYRNLDPAIFKADAYSELAKHQDEYIYFRTDHHWTGLGAYYGYRAFCQAMGLSPTPLEEMEKTAYEDTFLGTLYGFTDNSPILLQSADRAEFYHPKHEGTNMYYSGADMSDGLENLLLNANVPQDNQYMSYIGGDTPLNLLTSKLENGKSILVLKDSYGNAFLPYLMDNYQYIYVVDPRGFTDPLLPFIQEKGIEDVLMMNYSFAVGNPTWLNGFDSITGYTENLEE